MKTGGRRTPGEKRTVDIVLALTAVAWLGLVYTVLTWR